MVNIPLTPRVSDKILNYIFHLLAQAKPTSIKDAIKKWEEKNGQSASEASEISLIFQWPPIEKMDHNLGNLSKCEFVLDLRHLICAKVISGYVIIFFP